MKGEQLKTAVYSHLFSWTGRPDSLKCLIIYRYKNKIFKVVNNKLNRAKPSLRREQ